jgi:GWxTD domain-containing protein
MFPSLLLGQRRERAEMEQPLPFQVETFTFPSTNPAQSRLDILFTLGLNTIVFVRGNETTSPGTLTGGIEVSIDVVDSSSGNSVASKVLRKKFTIPDTQQTMRDRDRWKGLYTFDIAAGTYIVSLEVSDLESKRAFKTKQPIVLRTFTPEAPNLSSILWQKPTLNQIDSLGQLYGRTIPLGWSTDGYFEYSGPSSDSIAARVAIYKMGTPEEGRTTVFSDSTLKTTRGKSLAIIQMGDDWRGYSTTDDMSKTGIRFHVPSEKFPQGRYEVELTVRNDSQTTTVTEPLTVRWMNMPVSLRSLAMAVPPLKYIMSETEYTALRDLNEDAQRKMLEQYWKLKDPTPQTAFNEMMDEFYRRVDEAIQQFQTLKQPNGSLSDRGKTYILYGQPTSQDRVLGLNSAPREVWFYKNLNRSFIFIDEKKSGDYKLATEQ